MNLKKKENQGKKDKEMYEERKEKNLGKYEERGFLSVIFPSYFLALLTMLSAIFVLRFLFLYVSFFVFFLSVFFISFFLP